MPAINAIFGGDSRPMEAEFAKAEAMATRFSRMNQRMAESGTLLGTTSQTAQYEASQLALSQRLETQKARDALTTEKIIEGSIAAQTVAQMDSFDKIVAADEAMTAKRIADIEM